MKRLEWPETRQKWRCKNVRYGGSEHVPIRLRGGVTRIQAEKELLCMNINQSEMECIHNADQVPVRNAKCDKNPIIGGCSMTRKLVRSERTATRKITEVPVVSLETSVVWDTTFCTVEPFWGCFLVWVCICVPLRWKCVGGAQVFSLLVTKVHTAVY